jgi:plasmid stabilization system protein ParE
VSRKAVRDLDDIWYFIAKDNESAARRLIERLHAVFKTLATQPPMGRAGPEITGGPAIKVPPAYAAPATQDVMAMQTELYRASRSLLSRGESTEP